MRRLPVVPRPRTSDPGVGTNTPRQQHPRERTRTGHDHGAPTTRSRTQDARFPVPPPGRGALARSGHPAARRRSAPRIAERLFRRAVSHRCRSGCVFPDGRVLGAGDRHAPVMRLVRPANVFAPAGRRRQDRLRRGLHDRGLDDRAGHRPRRPARPVRRPDVLAGPPGCCSGCGTVVERTQPTDEENTTENSRHNISRHYDLSNELFETFLDETMTYSSAWFEPGDTLADAQLPQDRRRPGPGPGRARACTCWRSAPAGAPWPSGPPRARCPGDHPDAVLGAAGAGPAAGRGGRRRRTWSTSSCRTTATRRGQYDAVVSVEMIEAVGEKLLAHLLRRAGHPARPRRPGRPAVDHHGARPDAWPPGAATPGSTSTSSRAGSSRRSGPSRTTWPRTPTLSIVERRDLGPHYAHTLQLWRERFIARVAVAGGLLRRHLPPDVGVLPGLLRGRLPRRLPRREPARPGPGPLPPLTPPRRSVRVDDLRRSARVWAPTPVPRSGIARRSARAASWQICGGRLGHGGWQRSRAVGRDFSARRSPTGRMHDPVHPQQVGVGLDVPSGAAEHVIDPPGATVRTRRPGGRPGSAPIAWHADSAAPGDDGEPCGRGRPGRPSSPRRRPADDQDRAGARRRRGRAGRTASSRGDGGQRSRRHARRGRRARRRSSARPRRRPGRGIARRGGLRRDEGGAAQPLRVAARKPRPCAASSSRPCRAGVRRRRR